MNAQQPDPGLETSQRGAGLGTRPVNPWRARLLAALVIPCLTALTVWQAVGTYRKEIADTEYLVQALARVSQEHIAGILRGIDQLLSEMAEAAPGGQPDDPQRVLATLGNRLKLVPEARSAAFIDGRGIMVAGTLPGMVGTDVHDREYFRILQDDPSRTVSISAPLQSRVVAAQSIIVARPVRAGDGRLLGVVAVSLDPSIFEDELRTVLPRNGGRATLIRDDGIILARLPDSDLWRGKSVARGQVFAHLANAPVGTMVGTSVTDGRERMIAYRRFENHPLVMAVGISLGDALAPWRRDLLLQGGATLLLALVTLGLAVVSDRRLAERQRIQQALAASEARYRMLTEHSPVGVFQSDADGTCLYVNERWLALAGRRREDLLGGKWCDVVHPDDRETVGALWRDHVRGDGEFLAEMRLVRGDGSIRWVRGHATALSAEAGPAGGLVGTIEDISAAKEMEAKTADLLARLDASNKELEQFAYVTSHDLQEPLRMIAGYAQLIERRYRGRLDSDADEFIAFLVDGAKRMQAMIQDLLDYSRVERLGGRFVDCDMGRVLDDVRSNLGVALAEAGGRIEAGPMPTVTADRSQMLRLLQNLIGNALKYRSPERPPLVVVSAEPGPQGWVFSVADNGIGIDPAYFDRIFLVFQRLHTREHYEGTGIGLAICKKIVERHGGHIRVESDPGHGSTFRFSIAVAQG